MAVTDFQRGIEQIEWIDNDTILFSAEEDPSLFERETKERKDDSNVVDDTPHEAPIRLFKFSIKDQKVTRLTDNSDWVENFELSHDKTKLVAVAKRELSYAWDQKIPPVIYLVNVSTGERTEILSDQAHSAERFQWAPRQFRFLHRRALSDDPKFLVASVDAFLSTISQQPGSST